MSDDDDEEWLNKFLEEEERLLTKGDELQKLSVIGSLPELLKYDQKGTVSKIIPKIQQELPNSSSEFNLAVSRMFNILMHMDIPVNLVPQILQGIENRDPIIANAWMETLLAVIPLLKEQIIKNDILKCAISKSQLSKAAYFRVSSCRILGEISIHRTMNPFEVKKDVLPLAQSLCQDCYYEVRAAMCRELPFVAKGLFNLGDAIVKVNLLPLLVELSADENILVRSIAIESMVAIIPYLSADTTKSTIIPLAKKLCTRSASDGDTTYTAIANVFSMLIGNLQPQMSSSDAMWFMDYYSHICKKGLSLVEDLDTDPSVCMICRENCSYCLPKVASMVLALIPTEITVKWYHTFKALAADPCYIVRKAVAGCFYELVRILGPLSKIIIVDFTKLLKDEDEEVLQALIPTISGVLELFVNNNILLRDVPVQATLDIGRAMLKCQNEAFKTNNWRMKECLLMQWEYLPSCFPSDFIHQHFSPVVLNAAISGKAKPVRSQATRTLLIFLKYSLKENHRKWIREMIQTQLCAASCCYSRQVFVMLCGHALDIFSGRYFKEYFFLPLLSLAEDRIAIVRLSMVKLCPALKQMLVLPADRALQLKLENILSKMDMMESDKDVVVTLKQKMKEMRAFRTVKNEVLMEDKRRVDEEDRISKGRIGGLKTVGPQSQKDDRQKENVEKQLPLAKNVMTSKPSSSSTASKRLGDINAISSPMMPFLDQHFYTDAGVVLPPDPGLKSPLNTSLEVKKLINSAENLTTWLDQISLSDDAKPPLYFRSATTHHHNGKIELEPADLVVSTQNVKPAATLTDSDVRALEGVSNMTDDLKTNIRTRPKRNSCVFGGELRVSATASAKRRSLNISGSADSKIPVCSRTSKLAVHGKSKSFSNNRFELKSIISRIPSSSNNNNRVLRRSSSSDKVDRNTREEVKFRRYSASDRSFRDSLRNNNAVDDDILNTKHKAASGLPLSLRNKKPAPK